MRDLLIKAITIINKDAEVEALKNIDDNTRLFELLDSMSILDLILEIENLLQDQTGHYIQIANDKVMDIEKTPFKTFSSLCKYLEDKVNG